MTSTPLLTKKVVAIDRVLYGATVPGSRIPALLLPTTQKSIVHGPPVGFVACSLILGRAFLSGTALKQSVSGDHDTRHSVTRVQNTASVLRCLICQLPSRDKDNVDNRVVSETRAMRKI